MSTRGPRVHVKLTLEYDGTDFEGWQAQPAGHRTVQDVLEAALAEIAGEPVRVAGAGRTDTGVHAEGQVAAATLATRLDPATLRRALNAKLPADVAVLRVEPVPEDFHPRFDARGKHYRYAVWNAAVASPLRARRSHHVPQRLDLEAMQAGAAALRGRHDFAVFRAAGSAVRDPVRRLHRVDVEGVPGALVRFDLLGSGFLRHMVRAVVGTLLEVGLGRRPPGWVAEVLASRERERAGPTAPARGLTLVRVLYAGGRPGPDASGTPRGD